MATYASENLSLCLVMVHLERVIIEVVKSDDEQQNVWHVSLVRDGQPQLEVAQLLIPTLVDVDAALEAHLGQLVLRVVVDVL